MYQHPNGHNVRLSARTIEDWYYCWLTHGLSGLEPKTRSDVGTTKLDEELCELLCRAKREKPQAASFGEAVDHHPRARQARRPEHPHRLAQRPAPPRNRDTFFAMLEHGLKTAGATSKLLSDPALEVIWRVSQGIPRTASRLLRASLMLAHERDLRFVDEHIVLDACHELMLERPSLDPRLGSKSRTSADEVPVDSAGWHTELTTPLVVHAPGVPSARPPFGVVSARPLTARRDVPRAT